MSRLNSAFLSAAIFVAAALGAAPALAAVYTGHWDPAYGPAFPSLGWTGNATFSIPDPCLDESGWIANTDSCAGGAMKILDAEINFYNTSDLSMAVVETLNFDPNVLVYKMRVDDSQLTGVSTDFLGPVQAFASIAGGGTNYFDLKFFESVTNNVQLFHTVGHTDPICAYTHVPEGCGFSATMPTMTLTPVPEPGTFALCLGGLMTGWMVRRRRQ